MSDQVETGRALIGQYGTINLVGDKGCVLGSGMLPGTRAGISMDILPVNGLSLGYDIPVVAPKVQLNAQGVTIVLTTHYLEEAEQLCDRIAIIHHGRVIANEPTRELIAKAQEKAVVVTFDRDIASVPANPCFEDIALVDERTLEITFRKDKVNAGEVLGALTADGLSIVDVTTRDPDLEDVFLSLVSAGQEAA